LNGENYGSRLKNTILIINGFPDVYIIIPGLFVGNLFLKEQKTRPAPLVVEGRDGGH
jgi:hypothetical protein